MEVVSTRPERDAKKHSFAAALPPPLATLGRTLRANADRLGA
jgi:hypothetical protein